MLYAADETNPNFGAASAWLSGVMNGVQAVGLPWQTIGAFLRISTHPRIWQSPITSDQAWKFVHDWLAREIVWIPPATERTAAIYGNLCASQSITGNLVPDAQLAALAIEHGLVIQSADAGFARFRQARWENPLRA